MVDKFFFISDYLFIILEFMGIVYLDDCFLDGKSMLLWLVGEIDKFVLFLFFDYQGQVAIIDGQYKLYKSEKDVLFELYDLIIDFVELKDQSEVNLKIKVKLIDVY